MIRYGEAESLFEWAENKYNRTKPVNGSTTPKSLDVRPLGDRSRKWERIVKVDERTYVLDDGCYAYANAIGQDVKRHRAYMPVHYPDNVFLAQAPMVIHRPHSDAPTELRLGICGKRASNTSGRVNFINDYLPRGISVTVVQRNRQLYFVRDTAGEMYYLPHHQCDITTKTNPLDSGWRYLTFKESEPNRFCIHEESNVYADTAGRVDKELKKQYAGSIKEFVNWAYTMSELLRPEFVSDDHHHTIYGRPPSIDITEPISVLLNVMMQQDISEEGISALCYNSDYVHVGRLNISWQRGTGSRSKGYAFYRSIMTDVDHPQRAVLASIMLSLAGFYYEEYVANGYTASRSNFNTEQRQFVQVPYVVAAATPEEIKQAQSRIKAKINRAVNKLCGFIQ